MVFQLAPDISFCDAGGRFVFLDLAADRYFCLGTDMERSFARLVAGEPLSDEDCDRLTSLVRQRLLVETDGPGVPSRFTPPISPVRSAFEGTANVGLRHVVDASVSLVRARIELRCRALCRLIGTLRAAKAGRLRTDDEENAAILARTFRRAALTTGSLNQCLAISIAMTRTAIAGNLDVDLVMGVRLRPFQAHAWVQHGELVLSDELDTVIPFTPIFSI
ncbi:lasso peptide biosynthesis B2 protein [Stakelama saccharophila]|uniref:Lasso peptide biosynthesis B2 protein n=1 Tax=Stakelama saccharophila TaxID=3075605 RepID=A0ABZ0B9D0_9SPHN|nr:lasso peptide biosynthesis B2 protein [Stakelama sp. W311]WNO53453.1 lasso peptide biosynthesis B2 protein [Stakelama sp. W311]|tara:strand:- start:554 stop:1213 length:660 start_codon:yes stop_codon:yes gene_type:complete